MSASSMLSRSAARPHAGAVSPRGVELRNAAPRAAVAKRAGAGLGSTAVLGGGARSVLSAARPARSAGVCAGRATQAVVAASATSSGSYDYIIVGGGTAGCILANKLTADGTKSVLMLEAGGDNANMAIKTPAGITRLFKSALDWNLYTKSMPGLNDATMYLARGKVLGGSSSTNATLYHRGSRADYEAWGLPDWSADECYKWFKKSEDCAQGENDAHGVGGTMHHEKPRYHNGLHDDFKNAMKAQGVAENPDFNDWSRSQLGVGDFDVTQEKGQRADMFQRALKPALGRKNLTVVTRAQATKIVMDTTEGAPAAQGVEYTIGANPSLKGEHLMAGLKPGGEVLLTAGAVQSPHLMKLSGMGPRAELEDVGIPVVADLPAVGENLQDHPACLSAFFFDAEGIAMSDEMFKKNGNIRMRTIANYLLRKRGPLATTGCDRGAFVRTDAAPKDSEEADLQIRFVPAFSLDANGVNTYTMWGKMKEMGESWPGGMTFQLISVRPKSRGSVTLRSADPYESPNVDAGSLRHPDDLATLREGIKLTREVVGQTPLARHGVTEGWPGADVTSDEQLDAYIRRSLHSANALVGTCAMGTDASSSVVGSNCTVHGTRGLRIVDSSVVPTLPGGQTGAVTAMVAERLAAALTGAEPLPESPEAPPTYVPQPVAA